MPSHGDATIHTHCVVRWQDSNNQYAIVDIKRAKTAVTTLKKGTITLFEGYNRERRRGEILYLGTKKDCLTYGFDLAENDGQLNIYSWSSPPGLREQSEALGQAIRANMLSSFQRTISSSSTTSSITVSTKQKRKKINKTNQNDTDEVTTFDDNSTLPTSSTSTLPLIENVNSNNKNVVHDESSDIDTDANGTTTAYDIQSLLDKNEALIKEVKILREKILTLEDELLYQRQTSISLPDEATYNYLKSLLVMYERTKDEYGKKAVELGEKLPCSNIELQLAKQPNVASTINNLVKCCFKGIDLKTMSYTKLYESNGQLLDHIYDYVKHIHAPVQLSKTKFSSTISLKSRHLRQETKRKNISTTETDKQKSKKIKKNHSNKYQNGNKQNSEISSEILIHQMDCDKENTNDHF